MTFTIRDFQQVSIASFTSVLFFFALKRGENIPYPYIDPAIGVIITITWVVLHVNHTYSKRKILPTLLVTLLICTISAMMFDLITIEQIFNAGFFGSIVIISTWMAFPISIIFEKMNITNPTLRYYVKKR